ncbi:MAG: ROK family protein [Clostridiales bacterium]|nr:ROK family protein [Clostridiales bacterium]
MLRLGVDIGGTNVAMGLVDEAGRVVFRGSSPFLYPHDPAGEVKAIIDQIQKTCADAGIKPSELEMIGLAVPGSVDMENGVVIHAHNLGFHNLPLRALIAEALEVPVFLANDADAAALAEWKVGALQGCGTAALITLGTGVGGGLILNGKLWSGGRGNGVELGHMMLKHGHAPCSCGNLGCVESYCSATRLARDGGLGSAKAVFDAAASGDHRAQTLLADYIDDLGSALASIVNLLDPERIAIGGGVSGAGEALLAPLRENMALKCFFATPPDLVCATLGNDAGFIGAAMLG